MGEAKRRQSAQTVGRPWPPRVPAAVSRPGSSREVRELERLGQLSKIAEVKTREALQAARAATEERTRLDHLRSIMHGATALLENEVEQAYAAGEDMQRLKQAVACRKGCAFCCHMAVEATIIEAIAVWRRAAPSPALTAAIRTHGLRSANVEAGERWRQRVPCPMLGADGACQVYEDRPGSCRAFVSLDVKACERALHSAGTAEEDLSVPIVPFPRKIDTAIGIGVRRACAAENLQSCNVELTAALHLLATDPTAPSRWLAGETVFTPYP